MIKIQYTQFHDDNNNNNNNMESTSRMRQRGQRPSVVQQDPEDVLAEVIDKNKLKDSKSNQVDVKTELKNKQNDLVVLRKKYPHLDEESIKRINFLSSLSEILDTSITLPYLNFSIGIDPIIGMIPVLGDVVGLSIGGYLVCLAAKW